MSPDWCEPIETSNHLLLVGEGERKTVKFSTLEIREHAVVLGTNPSTSHGASLEIDWEAQSSETFDLDCYEVLRPPRRVKKELAMPGFVRENFLLDSGYTKIQIDEHVRKMEHARRRSSWQTIYAIKNMESILTKTGRSLQKIGMKLGGSPVRKTRRARSA